MDTFNVRSIDAREYEESKALWLSCFTEDSPEFVDYFYSQRTRRENVIAAFDGEKLCSMLHIIPMRFDFGASSAVDVGFVSGVCTLADYRMHGAARLVIRHAISTMRNMGFKASVLQPSSTGFYEKFGYRVFSERPICLYTADPSPATASVSRFDTPTPEGMLKLYSQYMRPYMGMSQRNADLCSRILKEFSIGDTVSIASKGAYALGYIDGVRCTLSEFVYLSDADGLELLKRLRSIYDEVFLPMPRGRWLNGLEHVRTECNMLLVLDSSLGNMLDDEYARSSFKAAFSFDSY